MTTKEDIDNLLSHIHELEQVATGIREEETIPASFFSHAFEKTTHIISALRLIEQGRIERMENQLRKQFDCVEEIRARIKTEEERIRELKAMKTAEVDPAPVPAPVPVPVPVPVSVPKQDEKPVLLLNEILEKKHLADLKKSFSLNDRFLFRKELFGGDEAKMTKVIDDLNGMTSLQEAMTYIKTEMTWDTENTVVADFVSRLEKRFN